MVCAVLYLTSGCEMLAKQHIPTAAIALKHHLGHIAVAFPIAVGKLNPGGGGIKWREGHINLTGLFSRKPHVKIKLQVRMRGKYTKCTPMMFNAICGKFNNPAAFTGLDGKGFGRAACLIKRH